MTTVRFNIGDAFPAVDPVARFVTVVALMSNDWLRLMAQTDGLEDYHFDSGGIRLMSFRQQASLYLEAADFVADARRRFPEIERFISGLDDAAKDACDVIVGGADPASPHYQGKWLTEHRNVTFHYPELHLDKSAHGAEELTEALKSAADLDGTITEGNTLASLRFEFADDVIVQLLPDHERREKIICLREAVAALGLFARRATEDYLASRPDGTFTAER